MQEVAGQPCVVGSLIALDVDDRYAFDIDEPVEVSHHLRAVALTTTPFAVAWDKNGGEGYGVSPDLTGRRR